MVVQDDVTGMDLSKIVVPLDETQESLQIEQVTTGIAEMFKSEVHILTEKKIDSNLKLKVAVPFPSSHSEVKAGAESGF